LAKPLQNDESPGTNNKSQKHIHSKGVALMAKGQDSRKETKKQPAKSAKEKRADKKAKKKG